MSSSNDPSADLHDPDRSRAGGPGPGGRPKHAIYAGFRIRLVALLIDWAILAIPQFLYFAAIGAVMSLFEGNESLQRSIAMGGFLGLIALIAVYSAGMESSAHQATPGKRLMGTKVADVTGGRISFGRALGRHFAKVVLSSLPLAFGFLMAGFTARKRALHDLIAGTIVLKA